MRNWNWLKEVPFPLGRVHCEPTYEELKLSLVQDVLAHIVELRAYLWGIETQILQILFQVCTYCEPTYEELKLVSVPAEPF